MFNQRLVNTFKYERANNIRSGVYGLTQREFAFNSNKIEGSRLTKEHTDSLFDTGSIYVEGGFRARDVAEATGHFAMFDVMLDTLDQILSESLIKLYHMYITHWVFEGCCVKGEYKIKETFVGGMPTALPAEVPERMGKLMSQYWVCEKSLENLARFHAEYEKIHPFQDGNGGTGRMILFRECLVHGIAPFIVRDVNKSRYINALIKAQNGDASALVKYFKEEQSWYADKVEGSLI